jgi:hypothetical protein
LTAATQKALPKGSGEGKARSYWVRRVAGRAAIVVLAAFVVTEIAVAASRPTGWDYELYMDATRRWLAGGAFYPAAQVAGPYQLGWGAVLYPPQMLAVFVPFAFLPPLLWYVIPIAVTLAVIAWHRPSTAAIVAMLALPSLFPMSFFVYLGGTPTIWIVAFLALATRWPAVGALVLLKPSLAPFALLGVRRRRWWLAAGVTTIAGLALLPLTLEWLETIANARGPLSGPLYSLENVPVLLVPLVARIGQRRQVMAQMRAAPLEPEPGSSVPMTSPPVGA